MINPGDIVSYNEMCLEEGYSLQRGMNFQVNRGESVIQCLYEKMLLMRIE